MSLDFTKPLQLSDGTPLRLLCTDAAEPYPVVCLSEKTKLFVFFNSDGKRSPGSDFIYLMNVPEQVTVDVWVNVYKDPRTETIFVTGGEPTKEKSLERRTLPGCCIAIWQATLHIKRTVPVGHVDEE